jgi:hypothetical protein
MKKMKRRAMRKQMWKQTRSAKLDLGTRTLPLRPFFVLLLYFSFSLYHARDDDKQLDQIMQDIVDDLGIPAGASNKDGAAGDEEEMPTLEEDDSADDIPILEDDDSEDDMEDEVQLQVVDKQEGEEKGKEAVKAGEPSQSETTSTTQGVTEQQLQDVMANMTNWMPIPGMGAGGKYYFIIYLFITNKPYRTPHASCS